MDHDDHVDLIQKGVTHPSGIWADFGSGRGAFTLALADLLDDEGEIYSVDKNRAKLADQQRRMRDRFPGIHVHYLTADYTHPLDLPPLDGIVTANALHFQKEKGPVLNLIHGYLRREGTLILVEYNVDQGNRWVPYPLSFLTWEAVSPTYGFFDTMLLETKPSRFLKEIYAAASRKGDRG